METIFKDIVIVVVTKASSLSHQVVVSIKTWGTHIRFPNTELHLDSNIMDPASTNIPEYRENPFVAHQSATGHVL